MTKTFWGYGRSDDANEFMAEIEHIGGSILDHYTDCAVEGPGGWYVVVEYELPADADDDVEPWE